MSNVVGTSAADALFGVSGDNTIAGLDGADKIVGGAGNDLLDGGGLGGPSGSDTVSGNAGDDRLVFTVTENAGAKDVYDGGSGTDILRLNFTYQEWLASAQDIATFSAFVDTNTHWRTLEANNSIYNFSTLGLSVSKVEKIELFVDGVNIGDAKDDGVVLGADNINVSENGAAKVNVLANDTVPDLVGNLAFSQPVGGMVTLVASNYSGPGGVFAELQYAAGSSWDYLAVGQSGTDSFTYTVRDADGDEQTATVNVTITGTNDEVVITSSAQAGTVTEDAASPGQTATGSVTFTDADLTDVHTASASVVANAYGAFALATLSEGPATAAGSVGWTYTLDNGKAQSLGQGQTVTETYTVTVADTYGSSQTQNVAITITGTNDEVVITSSAQAGTVTEDAVSPGQTATGSVTFTDADLTDVHTASASVVANAYGAFALATLSEGPATAAGSVGWTYTLDNAKAQSLGQGQTVTETYTVTVADTYGSSQTQNVAITITGVNDAPALTGAQAALAPGVEDTGYTISKADLLAGYTDVDAGDVLSVANLAATNGVLTVTADGWSFAPNANFNGAVNLTYDVVDATTGSVAATQSFTLAAVNDAPVAVADTLAATEDTPVTFTAAQLLANDTDVDNTNADLRITSVTSAAGGTAVLNTDGTVTFTPNLNFNGAADFSYVVGDGALDSVAAATVTVNVAAVNDAASIGNANPASVSEDVNVANGNLTVSGILTITDPDGPAQHSFSTAVNSTVGNLGSLTLQADGSYTYSVANSAVQSLNSGQTKLETFTVASSDGTEKQLTFTINGADEPILRAAPSDIRLSPDLPTTDNNINFNFIATLSASDVDAGAFTFTIISQTDGGVATTLFSNSSPAAGASIISSANLTSTHTYEFVIRATQAGDPLGMYRDETFRIVTGQDGNKQDTLSGVNVDDTLYGVQGQDYLFGFAGDDVLFGQEGNDQLFGGDGADRLVGGAGADTLEGGSGSDVFVLTAASGRDRISDFLSGTDKIDVSAIDAKEGGGANTGDQAFVSALQSSTLVAHSVTWFFNGADTIIRADTDGNIGAFEMEIVVTGNVLVNSSDFIL